MISKKILLKATCLLMLVIGFSMQANAQAVGDYRSNAPVFNWNAAGNWGRGQFSGGELSVSGEFVWALEWDVFVSFAQQ
ncbi:MAG: hypothetical protein ACK424_11235 [Candidatus Thermochlorobacter sp.]